MKCTLFYLPLLHRSIAAATLPGAVLFFPTGLQEKNEAESFVSDQNRAGAEGAAKGQGGPAAREAIKEALPFNERQARVVLADMLDAGEVLTGGGFLRQLSANNSFMQGRFKWEGAPGESDALAAFAATGTVADAKERGDRSLAISQALADCQKVLLLTWWHEEKLVELAALEQRVFAADHALCTALGDNVHSDEFHPQRPGVRNSPEYAVVPWRVVMDAALPFLPDSAAFFTADETMALDMRDAGILQPLTEDMTDIFSGWPPEMLTGLLYAELPGWRLVGRKAPLAERPWLERVVSVFVARPQNGWV